MSLDNKVAVRQFGVMRLLDWMEGRPETLEQLAPSIGVNASNLSKISRGLIWVSGVTAARIREVTDGAVTLDDLHDAWREVHPKIEPPLEGVSAE